MRIASGRLKGKKIFFPSLANNKIIKPTESIVKESLISILRPYLSGMIFLDLFAGSGAVGLEAYSNGAKKVIFVEKNPRMAETLKKTLNQWDILGQVLIGDYHRYLEYFRRKAIAFDAVYIDPPYHTYVYSRILNQISISKLIKKNGWVMIERHYRSNSFSPEELKINHLVPYRNRKYGNVCLDVYRINYHSSN